jgi:hypothetical protein
VIAISGMLGMALHAQSVNQSESLGGTSDRLSAPTFDHGSTDAKQWIVG